MNAGHLEVIGIDGAVLTIETFRDGWADLTFTSTVDRRPHVAGYATGRVHADDLVTVAIAILRASCADSDEVVAALKILTGAIAVPETTP